MRLFVIAAALVLFVLHQDLWFWDDRRLLLDFLPVGLAYHVGFSIAASLLWALAVVYAWPTSLDAEIEPLDSAGEGEKAE